MAIKFDVLNRFTGAVQFTAEIECDEGASVSVKLGLAVRWAVKARVRPNLAGAYLVGADLARANLAGAYLVGADLARANLAGAYLVGADLARANLAGANLVGANLARVDLIDGGQRSDGYRFIGSIKDGVLMISAGCRYFALADARSHWSSSRGGTALGDETQAILDHIERVANVRGLITAAKSEAA
jgi:hypothetical protein